ncbi:MAG: hypothetical protein KAJ96_06260, partial [Candidatus Thorarchaeota archaeon]|nr:hypothetical protein [Candidatus Thorarchaeota archaeon]
MERRKLAAIVLILAVVSMAAMAVMQLLPPPIEPEEPESPFVIVPDPFNALNWWDIAYDLGEVGHFLKPLSQITGTGNRFGPSEGYYAAGDGIIERLASMSITAE